MSYYSTINHKYAFLWDKYRPAILKFMIDSKEGPQEYKLFKHEFQNIAPNEKGGYAFILRMFKGKAVNDIRTSAIAKDLLVILQQSNKASELSEDTLYEFKMDKNLLLSITQEEVQEETKEETKEEVSE